MVKNSMPTAPLLRSPVPSMRKENLGVKKKKIKQCIKLTISTIKEKAADSTSSPPSSSCGISKKATLVLWMFLFPFQKRAFSVKTLFLSCCICCVTACPAVCFRFQNYLNWLIFWCRTQICLTQHTWEENKKQKNTLKQPTVVIGLILCSHMLK